jgi:broad specificity phosphatase PhoE
MSNSNCTLYIVRHGQTEWNKEGRMQGHMDSPLTAEGLEQAKLLGKRLKNVEFDAAFSSDLLRARRTAEIVALEHNLVVTTTEALREKRLGTLEGKKEAMLREELKELMEKFDLLTPEEKYKHKFFEDMESDDEIATRFITYLREIAVAYRGKTILIVCHGRLMWAFLLKIGFATFEELAPKNIKNTAYFKLLADGVDFVVKETEGIHKINA